MPAVLSVHDLTYRVGAEDLVGDLNLEALSRERVLLDGPSGSGKSTICRLLARRIPSFLAEHIRFSPNSYYAGRLIFTRFQVPATAYVGSVPHRQLVGVKVMDLFPRQCCRALHNTLRVLLLPSEFAMRDVGTLSSGEAARTALAAVLHSRASLAVLDDPWNWIDSDSRMTVAEAFYRHVPVDTLVEASSAFVQCSSGWTLRTTVLPAPRPRAARS